MGLGGWGVQGLGDLITPLVGDTRTPPKEKHRKGRKRGQSRKRSETSGVLRSTVRNQPADLGPGPGGLTGSAHGAFPNPLGPVISCSLVPSPITLPHPGTPAGNDALKMHWAARGTCEIRKPLSLCWLLPQPVPIPAPGSRGSRKDMAMTCMGSDSCPVTDLWGGGGVH